MLLTQGLPRVGLTSYSIFPHLLMFLYAGEDAILSEEINENRKRSDMKDTKVNKGQTYREAMKRSK